MKRLSWLFLLAVLSLFIFACASQSSQPVATPTGMGDDIAPVGSWADLLKITPLPYADPLPDLDVTPIDGTYVKFDPNPPQWWVCLRCADYRQAGGIWRMKFDGGVMRIYYEVTGWRSLASYRVSGDHLYLFNDPYCKEETGEYRWKLEDETLKLDVVNDPCSFELRGKNLSKYLWDVCPRNETGNEKGPRGCTDPLPVPVSKPVLKDGLTVIVREEDVRLVAATPDMILNASGAGYSLPEGVHVSYSEESMPYGVNRVLWHENDWMELTFSEPFTAVGVQFRGSYVIGWARVLFDRQEIWRGDTAEIWSELKVHGGYIEVMGFGAGKHIMRVERLDVDSRPVMVAFFGLSE